MPYYASIREDNKTVYMRDQNTDTILYDFNVGLGYTIDWYGVLDGYFPVVDSIDSIQINGNHRKRIRISTDNSWSFFIIEGIGCTHGFIPAYVQFESYKHTYCYHLNGDLVWKADCYTKTNQIKQSDNISINPNPTSDILNIQFEDFEQRNFVIYNQLGQQVFYQISNENNVVLNVEHLPKGFYVLAIETEKGRFTKKIVKE